MKKIIKMATLQKHLILTILYIHTPVRLLLLLYTYLKDLYSYWMYLIQGGIVYFSIMFTNNLCINNTYI